MGRMALHWTVAQGFVDTIIFLVEIEKIDLNTVFRFLLAVDGLTLLSTMVFHDKIALHLATINNHVEVV